LLLPSRETASLAKLNASFESAAELEEYLRITYMIMAAASS